MRDEIDYELLTNDFGNEKIFTNVFNADDFSQPGNFEHINVAGLDLSDWNVYEMRWHSDRIEWYINDQLIRMETAGIPTDPQEVRINIWAPDVSFPQGYNSVLMPAASSGLNQVYEMQVDFVRVSSVPVPAGIALFPSALLALSLFRKRRRK